MLIKRVREKGRTHMAGRVRTMISQIFCYAIGSGLVLADPARAGYKGQQYGNDAAEQRTAGIWPDAD